MKTTCGYWTDLIRKRVHQFTFAQIEHKRPTKVRGNGRPGYREARMGSRGTGAEQFDLQVGRTLNEDAAIVLCPLRIWPIQRALGHRPEVNKTNKTTQSKMR